MRSVQRIMWIRTFVVVMGASLALLAVFQPPAFAQGRVCADDVAKFCQDVKGHRAKVMQCLSEHRTELSPQCQARVQAMEAKIREVSDACQDDVQQFCQRVNPGQGRLVQCLRKHESELSSACQAEIARARSMRRSNR
jgi:Cysteine rich repeat